MNVREKVKIFEPDAPTYTRKQLLAMVKKKNASVIKGYHAMTKAQLAEALKL